MNPHEIARIERHFHLSLPEGYVRVIGGSTARRLGAMALETDASRLKEANEGHRRDCPWGFEWRSSFWWIGEDGAGGFYFIDTAEGSSTVYYFDCESSPLRFKDRSLFSPSEIDRHVASEEEMESEMLRRDEAMTSRVSRRRWWQFWLPKAWPPTG